MIRVIMTGASGMIGSLALQRCLEHDDVDQVTSLVRSPSGISHPKLREVVHHDFNDYSEVADLLKEQDICLFCLGVYTGQVDRETFRNITVDYTVTFANALHHSSPQAVFCFLSGQGADRSEKSRIMFAKDKGVAENGLLQTGLSRLHIFRPGYIYPVTLRTEPNLSYRIMRLLYKSVSKFYPNIGLRSDELADAMVYVAFLGSSKITFENQDIRDLLVDV
jgi:uncharacterized protein YbjT (DUF2867 family)